MDERTSPIYLPFTSPRRPIAGVTWFIVGSTVAVFLLQLWWLHTYGEDTIGNDLAFGAQAWAEHHYWTLITYAWAHAVAIFGDSNLFWLHIVSNMIPLICLGPALEEVLGHARFLGLYLGGAIASALVWFYFAKGGGNDDSIIGASGAVFAVIAAMGTALPRARVTLLIFYIIPVNLSMRSLALVACGLEVAQMLFHWLPEVAHSAHLGGAVFGFLYVLAIRRKVPRQAREDGQPPVS